MKLTYQNKQVIYMGVKAMSDNKVLTIITEKDGFETEVRAGRGNTSYYYYFPNKNNYIPVDIVRMSIVCVKALPLVSPVFDGCII